MLAFNKPTTNTLAYLASDIVNPISFAAAGGQNSAGSIGGSNLSPISQLITCDTSNTCSATGTFSNGLISQDMAYQINLNPEDSLNNGSVQFTRSSGYDLNSFNIQIASVPDASVPLDTRARTELRVLKNQRI